MSKGSNTTRSGSSSTTASRAVVNGGGRQRISSKPSYQAVEKAMRTLDGVKLPQFQGTQNKFKIGNVNFEVSWLSRFGGNGSVNSVIVNAKFPNGQQQRGEYHYGMDNGVVLQTRTAEQALDLMKEDLRNRIEYILKQK